MKNLLQFKTALIALILICACSATLTVKAQSTCGTAVSFTPDVTYNATTYNITDSIYWLKFVATDTAVFLKVVSPNQIPKANITRIYLYSGTCAGLTLLKSKGISDSLAIFQSSLIIGNTYYVKVNRAPARPAYFALASIYGPMIIHGYLDMCHGSTICDTIMNYLPGSHYDYHWGNTNPNAQFSHLSVTPIAGTSMAVFCINIHIGVIVVANYQLYSPTDSFNIQMDTMHIYACCNSEPIEFNDTTLSRDTTYTQAYVVNGTVILNANITFGGIYNSVFHPAILDMGPNAQIIIRPNKTLTIDSSIVKAGCDIMWNCIYITNNSANLIVKRHSTIRDGINAIVSKNGGVFNINASTLTQNYKSIVAHFYNNPHAGRITKSNINCTGLLKTPYNMRGTYIGIEADSVKKLFVGDSTTSVQNHFDIPNYGTAVNSTIGIYGTDSYIYAYNNLFTNFGTNVHYTTQVGLPYFGICTRAINANTNLPLSKLRVGYSPISGGNNKNTFRDCEYAIQTSDSKFTSIYGNTFIYDHLGQNVVYNNWGDAIWSYFVNGSPATNSIVNNTFTTYGNAIAVMNSNAASILCNSISLAVDPVVSGFYLRGICTAYCQNAVISSNTVTGPTGGNTDVNIEGLHVETGPGTTMGCNNSNTVGRTIIFGGTNTPGTSIYQNIIQNTWDGFYLNGTLSSPATVGAQGATNNPNDNQWVANFGNSYTFSNYSYGTASPFYVRLPIGLPYNPTSGPMNKWNPITYSPVSINSTGGTSSLTCTSCSSILPASMSQGMQVSGTASSELMDIAQGTSLSNLTNENKWLTKYFAYKDVLLNNIPTTGALSSFMQVNQSSDIGLLTQVNSLIETGNYAQASTTVGGIATSSAMAANLKSFYTLYAGNLTAGSKYTLSTAQNATLVTMAQQCPYTYGPAVYHARAYLQACGDMTIYQNACEVLPSTTSNAKLINPNNTQQEIQISVYPNPANDNVTVVLGNVDNGKCTFELFDDIGNKIFSKEIAANQNSVIIPLDNVAKGVYICRIIDAKNIKLYNSKLVIIK